MSIYMLLYHVGEIPEILIHMKVTSCAMPIAQKSSQALFLVPTVCATV